MKKIIAASLMALVIGATSASAEVKVGLGFGIDALSSLSGSFDSFNTAPQATIRVPVDFDMGLRVEPEIGIIKGTIEDPAQKDEYEGVVLALGGYYNLWKVEKVNVYAGGRLSLAKGTNDRKNKNTGVTNSIDTDSISLQALFGAEYYFVENMSFAAQAGLEFLSASEGNEDTTQVGTMSQLVLRYFF